MNRVILAYSGGLDTTVAIHWLKHHRGMKVITFSADVGQEENLQPTLERALKCGAEAAHTEDLKEEFLKEYAFKALRAEAVYGNGYLLATALSRPLIAKAMAELAREEGCLWVAHGCTGKGNDQVRIEAGLLALNPQLRIIAPLREWDLKTREEEIAYAKRHNLPITVSEKKTYSIDRNIWGVSVECGPLEDPWTAPPRDTHIITTPIDDTLPRPTEVVIDFENGIPVGLDGEAMRPVRLVTILNGLGGKQCVGRVDMIEDRTVGIKSREVYEAPAATILYTAHAALESLVLNKDILRIRRHLAAEYAELVYTGKWFSTTRKTLDAFFDSFQRFVTGSVRVELFKGRCTVTGVKSPHSLYEHEMATYSEDDAFDHQAASGFLKIWNYPTITEARRHGRDAVV